MGRPSEPDSIEEAAHDLGFTTPSEGYSDLLFRVALAGLLRGRGMQVLAPTPKDPPGMVPGATAGVAGSYQPPSSLAGKHEEDGASAGGRRVTSVRGRAGEVRPRSGLDGER